MVRHFLTVFFGVALVTGAAAQVTPDGAAPMAAPGPAPVHSGSPSPAFQIPNPAGAQTVPSKSLLSLSATFSAGSAPVHNGIEWRVFAGRAAPDGSYPLVAQ